LGRYLWEAPQRPSPTTFKQERREQVGKWVPSGGGKDLPNKGKRLVVKKKRNQGPDRETEGKQRQKKPGENKKTCKPGRG